MVFDFFSIICCSSVIFIFGILFTISILLRYKIITSENLARGFVRGLGNDIAQKKRKKKAGTEHSDKFTDAEFREVKK